MYYNSNNFSDSSFQEMKSSSMGYVRVLHALPDGPNVDVYANDKLIAKNLAYGNHSTYASLPEGTYKITLHVAGSKDSPILSNMLTVSNNSYSTVAAIDTSSEIEFLRIKDSNGPIERDKSMIKFVHLSPNAPAVDITLQDGTILFDNVKFKEVTSYINVMPNNYTLQVRLAGTSTVVLTVPDVNLQPNKIYTVYAIGLAGKKPALEALLLVDGNTDASMRMTSRLLY